MNEVADDGLAGMNGNGGSGLICVSLVREPVDKLPSFFRNVFQMLPQLLVASTAAQLVHEKLRPHNKVCVLGPFNQRRDFGATPHGTHE